MSVITSVIPRLRCLLTTGLATLALLTSAQQAQAFHPILNAFNSPYPASSSGTNASCQLCHGSSTSTWNEYGWGLRQNGENFGALEDLTSINVNGGNTMLDEINASTQPGWTTGANNNLYNSGGLITSTQTAPGGIGTLDPGAPPANNPPVANDDSATTPQDTAVTVDVLANDTDDDGDTLSVASVTNGSSGIVTNNSTDVTYTPDAGFFGTETFT